MRIRIRHEITQRFEPGSRNMAVTVRLTPRSHEGQFILRWALDLNSDCRLAAQEDAFGNLCHTFSVDGPTDHLSVVAEGEVETQDTTGIMHGTVERFPPSLFLRQTDLTEATPAVVAFAESVKLTEDDPLGQLHALMVALHDKVEEQDGPALGGPLTANAALQAGKACSGGIAHLFTAAARHLGLPARHISGYLAPDAPEDGENAGVGTARHWAEAYAPKFGWISFDAGRNLCGTEHYVRLAVALDAMGVAPLRSTGLEVEEAVSALDSRAPQKVAQAQSQVQS
ncbi:UNVERIFIED_ORG: transglutaminase-like putative cysteine protease [Xanthobacter viscosus]|uniref:Transglutaminase family protein n=1 Tax=Xanthobacter autotrophicus TaxID=280 RepID=A0A6C1KJB4_XANAU|nr:transglutaminase family protein [Xanthobacter autotrophicus]TLX44388.1 transglutaminase family protein [Xanthobacter autotrophicus]